MLLQDLKHSIKILIILFRKDNLITCPSLEKVSGPEMMWRQNKMSKRLSYFFLFSFFYLYFFGHKSQLGTHTMSLKSEMEKRRKNEERNNEKAIL